jgi:transcriptional regulator with XRE-family HTH domain
MRGRNWKRVQPNSLRDAMRLCKDHALEKKNYSVERIADLMGITADLLYKWLASGKMPASSIPSYELITGVNFVTRWLAASTGYLMIVMPTGRNASAADMQALQEVLTTAAGKLIQFYANKTDATSTIAAIQQGMEGLASHKLNVEKFQQPEFEFNEE